jgi:hypothetical protein
MLCSAERVRALTAQALGADESVRLLLGVVACSAVSVFAVMASSAYGNCLNLDAVCSQIAVLCDM